MYKESVIENERTRRDGLLSKSNALETSFISLFYCNVYHSFGKASLCEPLSNQNSSLCYSKKISRNRGLDKPSFFFKKIIFSSTV